MLRGRAVDRRACHPLPRPGGARYHERRLEDAAASGEERGMLDDLAGLAGTTRGRL